jgi:hypothetical protein
VNIVLLFLSAMAAAIDGGAPMDGAVDERPSETESAASPPAPDAAPVHLRGRVLAKGSRGPLPDASLALKSKGASHITETDDQGQFDVPVDCGQQVIVVRAVGYDSLSFTHDACVSKEPLLLRLSPRPNLPLYETVVAICEDRS